MSANTISNTVIAETLVKAPRVKKATLSAKYSKFLVFGYGLVQSLQSQGVLSDEGVETAYGELKLLSSIEDQTQFYESVLDQSKETSKVMRKYVAQRLAPPKAPRAKKPRAKKEAKVEENKVDGTKLDDQKKKGATRTKKATRVESDDSNDIVAELVDAANAVPEVSAEDKKAQKEAEKKAKEAEKKAKADAKEAEKKAKSDAKEAMKKTKEVKEEVKEEIKEEEASDDEEIHTQEIDINRNTYLIDDENNLYSCVTHEEVGKYDPESKAIIPL